MRVRWFGFWLAALAMAAPAQEASAPAQDRSPIKVESNVRLVLVDAVVRDKKGNLVRNLTAKDFRVWEDDKEQTISDFSLETDSVSPENSPRLYLVFLFDNTTGSVSDRMGAHKDAADFVAAWAGPGRYMSVVNFNESTAVAQNFTSLPEPLRRAIDAVPPTQPGSNQESYYSQQNQAQSISDATSAGPVLNPFGRVWQTQPQSQIPGEPIRDAATSATAPLTRPELLDGLKALADSLAAVRGRKALVLFSAGFADSLSSDARTSGAIEACNKANVAVYLTHTEGLRRLADQTGGRVIQNPRDLVAELGKIASEQSERYVLGYAPADSSPGTCHTLRVAVDRSGLDVRARKEYCSTKPVDLLAGNAVGKAIEIRAAAPSAGNLAASIELPYFYSSATVAQVDVAMEIAAAAIKFEKVKGKPHADLNVLGIAYKPDGSVAGRFSDVVNLDFDNDKETAAFAKRPFYYEKQFDLGPGQYNLRVAFSAGEESFGKVEAPLAIDPWDGRHLGLSGVALSTESRKVPDLASNLDNSLFEDHRPLVANSVEIIPSGNNRCSRAAPCLGYVEIYEPLLAGPNPPTLGIEFRIVDRQTGAPKQDSGTLSVAGAIRPGNPVVPVALPLPVSQLAPGSYRLEVKALHSAGTDSVVRSVDFDVE
ncbi:MAG: VWA domain-containing protein [Bryobacteraceae bacterium]|jgi:VWFA-related protein